MTPTARNLPLPITACFALGVALLVIGWLLLASEASISAGWSIDIGPWGANLVVLGVIVGACGFWLSWKHIAPHKGIKIAGLLIALGVILLVASFYGEPVLVRIMALGALLSGIRGGAYHVAGFVPRIRHDGVMPLGEKAALFSVLANGGIAAYLVYRFREFALGDSTSELGFVTVTALIVGAVLVTENSLSES
jgi:hypothetical protein